MSLLNLYDGKLKMFCRLEPDEDGYPPVSIESLWVRPLILPTVILDNIPFYVKGIAPGDELAVFIDTAGDIWFQSLIKSAGRSVFRIHAENEQQIAKIREKLLELGAPSEVDAKTRLIAVEVPAHADIRPLLDYLVTGQESQRFDFEEGVLRHAIPD
jgi:Domain of unknown function (DUF4265)